ncbi:hypothetical protein HK097_011632, partial [Rhizophlyctis rosea]
DVDPPAYAFSLSKPSNPYIFNDTLRLAPLSDPGIFTVAAWVNIPDMSNTAHTAFVSKQRITGGTGWALGLAGSKLKFSFYGRLAAWELYANATAGRWTHVVGTYDLTTFSFYVDGTLVAQRALSAGAFLGVSEPAIVGAEFSNGGRMTVNRTLVADVGFWKRVLTPSEIGKVYSADQMPTVPDAVAKLVNDPATGNLATFAYRLGTTTTVKSRQAIVFTGPLPYVLADLARLAPLSSPGVFTVAAWVNVPNTDNPGELSIVAKPRIYGGTGWRLALHGNKLQFAGIGRGAWLNTMEGGAIVANQWHHGLASYDGVTQKLYLDGVLVAQSAVSTGGFDGADQPLLIGAEMQNGDRRLPSGTALSQVAVWSTTLTDAQIASLYQTGRLPSNSLVGFTSNSGASEVFFHLPVGQSSSVPRRERGTIVQIRSRTGRGYGKYGAATGCNKCPDGLTYCGNGWMNSVYTTQVEPRDPTRPSRVLASGVTQSDFMGLGYGYDSTIQVIRHAQCVKKIPATTAVPMQSTDITRYQMMSSTSQVEEMLSISASGGVSASDSASFQASLSAKSEFLSTSMSHVLVFYRKLVIGAERFQRLTRDDLVAEADQIIGDPKDGFRQMCGDYIFNTRIKGGLVYAKLTVSFTTEASKTAMAADVQAKFESKDLKATMDYLGTRSKTDFSVSFQFTQVNGNSREIPANLMQKSTECSSSNVPACLTLMTDAIAYAGTPFRQQLDVDTQNTWGWSPVLWNDMLFLTQSNRVETLNLPAYIQEARAKIQNYGSYASRNLTRINALLSPSIDWNLYQNGPDRNRKLLEAKDSVQQIQTDLVPLLTACWANLWYPFERETNKCLTGLAAAERVLDALPLVIRELVLEPPDRDLGRVRRW